MQEAYFYSIASYGNYILLVVVALNSLFLAETKGYLVLFRTHVSNNATGRGRALLEALELPPEEIAAVYDNFEKRESDSVQAGLLEWSGGRARSPSWEVLLAAMNKAGFAREHCEGLEGKLTGKDLPC